MSWNKLKWAQMNPNKLKKALMSLNKSKWAQVSLNYLGFLLHGGRSLARHPRPLSFNMYQKECLFPALQEMMVEFK